MNDDVMAWVYRLFWGANPHHGYFDRPGLSAKQAFENLQRLLAERIDLGHGEHVLDVGFGYGEAAMRLARERGCRVTGITNSASGVRIARYFARRRGLDGRVDFRLLEAERLGELGPGEFDAVWCLEAAEFIADKPRLFRDWYAAMKPGGRVVFSGLVSADAVTEADYGRYLEPISTGFNMPRYASFSENAGWLGDAGFADIAIEDLTREVLPTGEQSARLLRKPMVRAMCKLAPKGVRRELEVFPLVFEAYAQGSLRYGMFTAKKSGESGKVRQSKSIHKDTRH